MLLHIHGSALTTTYIYFCGSESQLSCKMSNDIMMVCSMRPTEVLNKITMAETKTTSTQLRFWYSDSKIGTQVLIQLGSHDAFAMKAII